MPTTQVNEIHRAPLATLYVWGGSLGTDVNNTLGWKISNIFKVIITDLIVVRAYLIGAKNSVADPNKLNFYGCTSFRAERIHLVTRIRMGPKPKNLF